MQEIIVKMFKIPLSWADWRCQSLQLLSNWRLTTVRILWAKKCLGQTIPTLLSYDDVELEFDDKLLKIANKAIERKTGRVDFPS